MLLPTLRRPGRSAAPGLLAAAATGADAAAAAATAVAATCPPLPPRRRGSQPHTPLPLVLRGCAGVRRDASAGEAAAGAGVLVYVRNTGTGAIVHPVLGQNWQSYSVRGA